ncbi:MAG: hypothetical protein KAU28_08595 [Phycisphaerae bacterium]|nr:hypothetical protein [Phycisphaerae bacterium]
MLSLLGIGDEIAAPEVYYDSNGVLNYDAASESFDAEAGPVAISFVSGSRPIKISSPRDFQLHIQVDNTGELVGGVAGDDLYIEGQIDVDRDGVMDYDGVLLTGEIVAFGHLDAGTSTDQYDFRLTPTGGDLMPFFEGMDIGLDMTSLSSTFVGSFAVNFSGGAQGVLGVIEKLPVSTSSLAGRVFLDADNNGLDDGEEGISDVTITLAGTDIDGNAVNLTNYTGSDGSYLFQDINPGTYTLTQTQPDGYLDGDDVVGSLGGVVGDDVISGIVLEGGEEAIGYKFGEILPSSLSGLVYEDFNDDGEINFGETAIEGVTATLTGVDDRGNTVSLTELSDADGVYFFVDLRPGSYTITETQPIGYTDGQDTLGTEGGTAGNDVFSDVNLGVAVDGMNYNFGERPEAGSQVVAGQTATIGFWQNKNGQALLKSINGGSDSTQLGNWLAATFPNIYGAQAGASNLTGKTNAEIADFYHTLFRMKKNNEVSGPAKVDCQVMATALAVYVTNSSLAGDTATSYGFLVTEYGVGVALFNVGSSGDAFNVEDNTEMTVLDLLLATDEQAVEGCLYDLDELLRTLANQVYSTINTSGDI